MTPMPAGPLLKALERHRHEFASLKAITSVEFTKRGRKRIIDTVGIVVDDQCRFRMEAYGPLGQSLLALVWNGQEYLLWRQEEDKVSREGRAGLERLIGFAIEPSELCSIMAGYIPEVGESSSAILLCAKGGDCLLEVPGRDILRKIRVAVTMEGTDWEPRILTYEFYRSGDLMFRTRFDHPEEISRYRLPMQFTIENPGGGISLHVTYSEAEVNTPVNEEVFSLTDVSGATKTK